MPLFEVTNQEGESRLWLLVPFVPLFLVGFTAFVVSGLTVMAFGTSVIDGTPAWFRGPGPVGMDQVFVRDVMRVDHWLVSLVGLRSPWLAAIPGMIAGMIWEVLTGGVQLTQARTSGPHVASRSR
jgi:hypothetical protein